MKISSVSDPASGGITAPVPGAADPRPDRLTIVETPGSPARAVADDRWARLRSAVRTIDESVDAWFEPHRGRPALDAAAKLVTGLGDHGFLWAAHHGLAWAEGRAGAAPGAARPRRRRHRVPSGQHRPQAVDRAIEARPDGAEGDSRRCPGSGAHHEQLPERAHPGGLLCGHRHAPARRPRRQRDARGRGRPRRAQPAAPAGTPRLGRRRRSRRRGCSRVGRAPVRLTSGPARRHPARLPRHGSRHGPEARPGTARRPTGGKPASDGPWNGMSAAGVVSDVAVVSFGLTWDYRCPFARNAHEHVLDGLDGGAAWDVTFVPFFLNQAHVPEGGTPAWEDVAHQPDLLPLAAGVVVRDRHPEVFRPVHRSLFAARHDDGWDLRDRARVAEALQRAGADADAVLAEVDAGWPAKVVRDEHEQAVRRLHVFGVPTFIVGDQAVFVRLMTRPQGDLELGPDDDRPGPGPHRRSTGAQRVQVHPHQRLRSQHHRRGRGRSHQHVLHVFNLQPQPRLRFRQVRPGRPVRP